MGALQTFFQKLLGLNSNNTNTSSGGSSAVFLNGNSSNSTRYTGSVYANHLVRGIVNKIASYCSLMHLEHCRGYNDSFEKLNDNIAFLLTVKPNTYMTPSELLYKFFTDLYVTNNAYLWLKRDKSTGEVVSIHPVVADLTEMLESNGFMFYRFTFSNGQKVVVPENDIIHRRRFFYKNDWFGEDNGPLRDSVGLVDTLETSVAASLQNGAHIKGILQHQNTIDPDDLAKHEQMFRESYLKASNSGGVGMIDAKFNFIPIPYSGSIVSADQMKEIRDYVYRYFNMNDEIMMSNYTSDKWQSFHEGTIAPELHGLEQSLRIKLFTDRQISIGHRIISSVNAITFMSPQQRIQMVKLALDGALYNRNEIREWFGDSPIPGGDVYQYSKNFTEDTPTNDKEEDNGQASETDTPDAVPDAEETN